MKTISSTFKTFTYKDLFILTCIIIGFASFTACNAQSIVGKWNGVSTKQFLTAEGAKTYGKQFLETQMTTIGSVEYEFKSDHTYVMKSTSIHDSSKVRTFTGTWSVTGNQLQSKLDPKQEDPKDNPKKDATLPNTTMSIKGNTMVWSTLYPDSKTVNKIEVTLTRM
jgi:Lipocalin-like domain